MKGIVKLGNNLISSEKLKLVGIYLDVLRFFCARANQNLALTISQNRMHSRSA
jgi:hypothetical protein